MKISLGEIRSYLSTVEAGARFARVAKAIGLLLLGAAALALWLLPAFLTGDTIG